MCYSTLLMCMCVELKPCHCTVPTYAWILCSLNQNEMVSYINCANNLPAWTPIDARRGRRPCIFKIDRKSYHFNTAISRELKVSYRTDKWHHQMSCLLYVRIQDLIQGRVQSTSRNRNRLTPFGGWNQLWLHFGESIQWKWIRDIRWNAV